MFVVFCVLLELLDELLPPMPHLFSVNHFGHPVTMPRQLAGNAWAGRVNAYEISPAIALNVRHDHIQQADARQTAARRHNDAFAGLPPQQEGRNVCAIVFDGKQLAARQQLPDIINSRVMPHCLFQHG
ncbi:hypothetical protein [Aquitalea magnusonii]|uniref:hypothetical protein n=1 Tax=Aquitalea magnusonii TaxID=332411 RepID=UPI0011AE19F8|nr:hypothetical protein [Aquitalea magnusonii]